MKNNQPAFAPAPAAAPRRAATTLALLLGLLALTVLACAVPGLPGGDTPTPEATAVALDNGTPPTPTLAPISEITPDPGSTPTPAGFVPTPTLAAGNGSEDGNENGSQDGNENGSEDGNENGSENGGEDGNENDGNENSNENGGTTTTPGCSPGAAIPVTNPSFEGAYKKFGGIDEINHAEGWFPWWASAGGDNFPPEYKPADASLFPDRVHSGSFAQQYFKSFGIFKAGLYQVVTGVPVGCRVRFTIYAQAWSCQDESGSCPGTDSVNPANMFMRIGIHPDGSKQDATDEGNRAVVWSEYANPLDDWFPISVSAVTQSTSIVIFLWASPDMPRRNQDVYWDDASVTVVQ